jgi:formate/nitrite transporter FocA (FNT family)
MTSEPRPPAPRAQLARREREADPAEVAHEKMREALDASASGAPAAGKAVRDLLSTDEIFRRLVATADDEFDRTNRLLFFSGLAAGFSVALSFIARVAVPAATGVELLGMLLYPIGFVFIVLGRYQLFTENTLTPVTLVLTRSASMPRLLKFWSVVYAANILGASLAAAGLALFPIFTPEAAAKATEMAAHVADLSFGSFVAKGVIAGWLVAGMVWLTHATREGTTRLFIVFAIMSLIPMAGLYHCVVGACEAVYGVLQGVLSLEQAVLGFVVPVTLGNTVGGVLLVALLNFAQTREAICPDRAKLSWQAWFFRDAWRPLEPETKDPDAERTGA